MTNPQPTEAALEEFYGREYRKYYQNVEIPTLEYIRAYGKDARAACIAEYLIGESLVFPGARVLDVGAGEGSVLRAIRMREPTILPVAIEPDRRFARFAAGHVPCRVYESFHDLRCRESLGFDLVISNHVLEHVRHPVRFLEDCRHVLATKGVLYLEVPDVCKYRTLEMLHIAHLYHFSRHTLTRAVRLAGFQVLRLSEYLPFAHPASVRAIAGAGDFADAAAAGISVRGADSRDEPNPLARKYGWFAMRFVALTSPFALFWGAPFARELRGHLQRLARTVRRCLAVLP